MSPRSMFSRCAVSGCNSTHELQQILVTGSGSSCSQGLFAPRPSPSAADGYVIRNRSPWALAIGAALAADEGAAAIVRAGSEPFASALGSAAAKAVGPP